MLAQYARTAGVRNEGGKDEEEIISSFYEERRSRNASQKYHNLLKKNISFFHPENIGQQEEGQESSGEIEEKSRSMKLASRYNSLSQPPLAPLAPNCFNSELSNEAMIKQVRSKSSVPLNRLSAPTFCSSLDSSKCLKDQQSNPNLNRRININSYLSKLQEENKQNQLTESWAREKEGDISTKTLKYTYKYNIQEACLDRDYEDSIKESFNKKASRKSDKITGESRQITDSKNSISKDSARYEGSKNRKFAKDKSHTFGTAHSSLKNSLHSQQSPQANSSFKELPKLSVNNCLSNEQLNQLQQNSHPLRQTVLQNAPKPFPLLKHAYFDPEQSANYKRRVQDLQRELSQLKTQHRRQQKFIQSIQKMRRAVLDCQGGEDCSLKQLWRWIKQLPHK